MSQLSLFQQPRASFSVSEINAYIRDLMESDSTLQELWVQGEISNLGRPASGHLYFTIKDAQASLRCVMWRSQAANLVYRPQNGDQVEVHGSISVYEAGGQYQLYADQIRPAGEGLLFQEYLRLKDKLEKEGLFAPERKRRIPARPGVIGIVTSLTGAALRDMLNTLQRRFPLVRVVLSPALVQGEAAPKEIKAAIERLNQYVQPDVILVGRGGGSIEDLWAFNDEGVARAVAASAAPVICGVGHETDFTIADFVADLRAPTPTAAAELATPDQAELRLDLEDLKNSLAQLMAERIQNLRWQLQTAAFELSRRSPVARLQSDRQRIDDLSRRAALALGNHARLQRIRLRGIAQQLEALNPQAVLNRGYALVTGPGGKLVKQVGDVSAGDMLRVRVSDGNIDAEVLP